MTTEAENLAQRLHDSHGGQSCAAIDMIRVRALPLALGADALAVTERLPDELPAHHPLMDARQSARQLVAYLKSHNAGNKQ